MASPLHYIFQAAMGQCSTIPTEKYSKTEPARDVMSVHPAGSPHGYKQQREERESYVRDGSDSSRRQPDGDVIMGDAYSPRSSSRSTRDRELNQMENVAKEGNVQFEQYMDDTDASHGTYYSARSSRSSSRIKRNASARAASHVQELAFYPPPEGATRTICYRLNLDVPVVLSPTHDALGPFHYETPSHLLPSYDRGILMSMSSESVEKSTQDIAIDTARIFRGIKVDSNGNIVSRNDRANRSRRGSTSSKTAENSRQSAKITKANDLVDEMVSSGKENDGEKPNMLAVYPIGEYDDMKQLVRDGARKLREAEGKGDEWILSLNRSRNSFLSSKTNAEYHHSPSAAVTSRRKISVSSSNAHDALGLLRSSSTRSKSRNKLSVSSLTSPPKLKGHPRDGPSRRMDRTDSVRTGENCHNMSLFGGGGSDWGHALNFNSIWNCGGTGTTIMSPSHTRGIPTHTQATAGRPYARYDERLSRGGASERETPTMR
mmetsp:Transcript_16786/g.31810  ORF Transcript_16786/g.31810 Transcript_16786/m.31810 type:complete len:489 (-) Transcript_16786:68-1534(-)|eukprot:CAMPEP_0176495150 /NCGR_PEP_ID=MMETSP0200_2-20121128/10495_1 /TAXON_ID=947934 /ORGANISM="Chaetoceros sp., Strain GSL56" /LENGTH=488 /DNA_ID=CAMNT_0017892993 /DNA_START=192 /DNA_END=1658 /DNA_ORIENTATION=-